MIYFATRSNGGGNGKKCPNNCSNNGSCTNGICNCENPGNQCYLLGKDDCLECLKPHYIGVKNLDDANKQCGNSPSLSNILSMYKNDQVNSLYQKVMDNVKPCTEPIYGSVFSQIKK